MKPAPGFKRNKQLYNGTGLKDWLTYLSTWMFNYFKKCSKLIINIKKKKFKII